jgi:hypothetical protein
VFRVPLLAEGMDSIRHSARQHISITQKKETGHRPVSQ